MKETSSELLEQLSFALSPQELSNLKYSLETFLQYKHPIPIRTVKRVITDVDKIAKLQLEGKIYAFHLEDSWNLEVHGEGEGYELFERRGNTLKQYLREYNLPTCKYINMLKKDNFNTIYTGNIPVENEFLGISYKSVADDKHSMTYTILDDREIHEFESYGIKVIVLESLI